MENLRQLLQDKAGWLASTRDATIANVRLTRDQLALLVRLLEPTEAVAALPKIEPRLLSPQEPRGTRRSPEEIARLLAERYGQTEEIRKTALANVRAG